MSLSTRLGVISEQPRLYRTGCVMVEEESLFQRRLKELRESRGYTQRELAAALTTYIKEHPQGQKYKRVTQSQIADWEGGRFVPATGAIKAMAVTFEVSVEYLLGMTGDPNSRLEEEKLNQKELIFIRRFRRSSKQIQNGILRLLELPRSDRNLLEPGDELEE